MDVATAQAHLDAWLAAELGLARNKSYTMPDGRTLTRADEAFVAGRISYWQGIVNALNAEAAGAANPSIKIAQWS